MFPLTYSTVLLSLVTASSTSMIWLYLSGKIRNSALTTTTTTEKEDKINKKDRVIGTNTQFVKYVVSVQYWNYHLCGAAIITDKWIISSAQCYHYRRGKVNGYRAIGGLHFLGETRSINQYVNISRVVIHPRFYYSEKCRQIASDIALLELVSPFLLDKFVDKIQLPLIRQSFTGRATVSGWGGYRSGAVPLGRVNITLLSYEECVEQNKLNNLTAKITMHKSMICGYPVENNHTVCRSDVGSPLVQGDTLIGIASFAQVCVITLGGKYISLYTKVSRYINFINKYVKDLY
ncbi:hypothetical protein ILUMI_08024 [Ignelater luminosus]|uniref:Peptidase S1 domain-containing protein n=1 Tax=Ignelater luminosus TaxID=2038154 RepID=A0A8K0GFT3_IGNLU|nr:hypothetical protein ILUMI_08024 [Ignelater luminosus]